MADPAIGASRSPGTVRTLVDDLAETLARAMVREARREARDIVAAVLDVPRFWPTMHPEVAVDAGAAREALAAARKRARGAPFAYAVGRAAFRHLSLQVDERVLIPRVETEELVEIALEMRLSPGGTAIDVGTGSGAIALALAMEARFDHIVATDISADAIAVARANAQSMRNALRTSIDFRVGALLDPVRGIRARLLISNPPYIAYGEASALPATVRDWEPPLALFAGDEGMAAIRSLLAAAPSVLEPGGCVVVEVDARRASLAAEAAAANTCYCDVGVRLDLAGRERYVVATNRE